MCINWRISSMILSLASSKLKEWLKPSKSEARRITVSAMISVERGLESKLFWYVGDADHLSIKAPDGVQIVAITYQLPPLPRIVFLVSILCSVAAYLAVFR